MLFQEQDFSFAQIKQLFIPLTTKKAIHWIIFIGIIVHANSLFNGFLWDDFPQLINNIINHSLINTLQFFSNHSYTYYRPFSSIIFAGMYIIFGVSAFWYHLVQLILHIIITVFLFILFKKFFKPILAFVLVCIFLIHPMNVESVEYISSLQVVLSLLFGLSALLIVSHKQQKSPYIYLSLFFLLLISMLSKETGLVFCILTPLLMVLNKKNHYEKRDYMLVSIALIMAVLFYLYFVFFFGDTTKELVSVSPIPIINASLTIKLLTLPKILFYYILTFMYPAHLAVSQQWLVKNISVEEFYIPLFADIIFFIGLFIAEVYLWKKKASHIYLFFLFWFLFSWGMVWQIVPLDMTVADRWFYIPMIGMLGLVGSLIKNIKINNSLYKYWGIWLLTIILIVFSVRTMIRSQDWRDELTLFSHDVQLSPESYDIENGLSYQYLILSEYDKAKPHIERSIHLAPNYWQNWGNLGVYYEGKGQIDNAIQAFSQATNNNTNYYKGYVNLASIYFHYKNPKEAKAKISKILTKYPHDSLLWLYLAISEYEMKDKVSSKFSITQAYKYNQSAEITNIYNIIMNDQPLNLNIHN